MLLAVGVRLVAVVVVVKSARRVARPSIPSGQFEMSIISSIGNVHIQTQV